MKKIINIWLLLIVLTGCGVPLTEHTDNDSFTETTEELALVHDDTDLIVHFIDVGQADATLFQTEQATILFDTGDWNKRDVVDYLEGLGIDSLDLVIGSHPDADHIGQMPTILNHFNVKEVWMSGIETTSNTYEQTLDAILEHDIDYHEPRAGEVYQLGSFIIHVISPAELTNDVNEDSIAIKLQFGETAFVLTGDAGSKAEAKMIEINDDISADLLHVGHHGSKTSSSQAFIEAVDPAIAIISAGQNNSYGHPDQVVLNRLNQYGATIYGTYQHGNILVYSDGQQLQVEVDHDQNQQDPINVIEKTDTCIDLNTASVSDLEKIVHIGAERAAELVQLRPIDSIEQLTQIKGISEARLVDINNEGLACVR
ncbi:MBL fold metallo-hydrolase [Amphibacillus sediminis]|uniref:MBL fold metallo-hydrolase n=1 Tax=Amphibacillus sediminis TaxID=360185 RepID=UPI00082C3FDD|nr:MBL fold metallo-hydrolase [Amphibacillus sediminis]